MATENDRWTAQQRKAIKERGRGVYVSASAGTGKTSVLSGRCIDVVADRGECTDVRGILVLTFTNAAADELCSRIAGELKKAFEKTGDSYLRRQLLMLDAANISTIHSFCHRLIIEHFYELGIDPAFRIIDDDEQRLLKAVTLDETIEWAWAQSNLAARLQQLLYGRNIWGTKANFLNRIIELSNFLDGVAWRENWYERALTLAELPARLAPESAERQKQIILDRLEQCLLQLAFAQKLEQKLCKEKKWAVKIESDYIKPIKKCVTLIKEDRFNDCGEEIKNFKATSLRRYNGMSEDKANIIKEPVSKAKENFRNLRGLAILNPDYVRIVAPAVRQQKQVLIELVKEFDRRYTQAKQTANCMDFADLEHHTLRLLTAVDSNADTPQASETAMRLRARYKYIFVDEYQDINSVQQEILKRISDGRNLFAVGDVKQSIYAFRGAVPEIFLKQLAKASPEPKSAQEHLRVDLNRNYRSRAEILNFANKVFERIMSSDIGLVDYDEKTALKAGAEYRQLDEVCNTRPVPSAVEIHIVEKQRNVSNISQEEDETDYTTESYEEPLKAISETQQQAALIAARIQQMVGGKKSKAEFQVYDKQSNSYRDVQYRDIVVLMRSLTGKVNQHAQTLSLAGIPVHCQSSVGYLAATEILDCLSLLKVLDNPLRDIELAAVLRSPFFKLSDTALAGIRTHTSAQAGQRNMPGFYECVCEYAQSGPDEDLKSRLSEILDRLEVWRTMARRDSLADMLWRIYRQTGYLSFVGALPNGKTRRANLVKLHDRAIQFEGFASMKGGSLGQFVEFIERLIEEGGDYGPADVVGPEENCVRIMSIHKSKGLEFPVVLLAETESKFNMRDSQGDILVDSDGTVGIQIIESNTRTRLDCLEHQILAEYKKAATIAEEMRILYVAMTRGAERLILTGSIEKKKVQNILRKGNLIYGERIPDWQVRSSGSILEWILYALANQDNLHKTFETASNDALVDAPSFSEGLDEDLFAVKLWGQTQLEQLSRRILWQKRPGREKPGLKSAKPSVSLQEKLSKVKSSIKWQYPFSNLIKLKAKESVSRLTHSGDEFYLKDYSKALERRPAGVETQTEAGGFAEPKLIGLATHRVIEKLDLDRPITTTAVSKTIKKLLSGGEIIEPVAEQIDVESIVKFFDSEPGRMATKWSGQVLREWPFTLGVAASELCEADKDGKDDDIVIIQGIIDMLIQTPAGFLIVDFKTDRIKAGQVQERAQLYTKQISLYSRAAEAILKSKLISKWLYFLDPGCASKVK
jgi:ATP-dependent helicase/nuclease subunit A